MASRGANEASKGVNDGTILRGEGSGRECLSECFLRRGAKLPLYTFGKSQNGSNLASNESQESFLNKLLQLWEEKNDRGLFHHDIAACETKILPGEYGFIVRLIEGRDIKKRPTEHRKDKVSPIKYDHILLIPHILEHLPQRMDRDSLFLSLYMAREAASPYFKIGYNSLGAFATINHLHFQAFHLPMPLSAEKASTEYIATLRGGVKVLCLLRYPVRGFVYEGGTNLQDLAYAVSNTCTFLEENNQPYNMLISDSGRRIFVFLQCYAERQALGKVSQEILDKQVSPAAWEISGYLVLKRREDYEEASEQNVCRFFAEVSLSEKFQELQESVVQAHTDEWKRD